MIQKLFKKYIVTRKNGQCQVLIPLVELDELCDRIEKKLLFSLRYKEAKKED